MTVAKKRRSISSNRWQDMLVSTSTNANFKGDSGTTLQRNNSCMCSRDNDPNNSLQLTALQAPFSH
jgi:hypothetical protein